MRVVGYVRVSTDEQSDSGLGLAAQREAIHREVQRQGWELVALHEDIASGKSLARRDGLATARRMIEVGEADGLIVAKLDRLSRSVADFSAILERFKAKGWGLVILDLGVDTTTVMGELMANVVAAVAQTERRRIGERTQEALAQARARGVRLGRPRTLPDAVVGRIHDLRKSGLSYRGIATVLSDEGTPTAQGGTWRSETVRKIVHTYAA